MKEVKSPKKPLIYYYVLVLAILFLFNMIVPSFLMRPQIETVDYGAVLHFSLISPIPHRFNQMATLSLIL